MLIPRLFSPKGFIASRVRTPDSGGELNLNPDSTTYLPCDLGKLLSRSVPQSLSYPMEIIIVHPC